MTLEEIKVRLSGTGYPVAYRAWPEEQAPPMPYLLFLAAGSDNFAADGGVYQSFTRVQIELYSKLKDQAAEEKVESALGFTFWEKTEIYLDSEKCYEVLYEIEV